ncbi:hypothetical protein DB30_07314 [Enhygromyxa salina]|uniref:Uncharacterized protein n=1 Tax=Enhygromyxa salina TaxID=215803 RepID=A0A0C2D1K7_9BACT|nr:hypothetical protein [Enhygromyxa salina]KIG14047.1 hypothetical protein DB30_07314 [Enhygromyxa salina]
MNPAAVKALQRRMEATGVTAPSTERLALVLYESNIDPAIFNDIDDKWLARLANERVLPSVERLSALSSTGRVEGLGEWMSFMAKKDSDADVTRTVAELREAERLLGEYPGDTISVGGDKRAPPNPDNQAETLASFDIGIKSPDGKILRSVDVTHADKPVKHISQLRPGVAHAAKKVKKRDAAGEPIPGKRDAIIRMELKPFRTEKEKGIEELKADGTYMRATRETPPRELENTNIYDKFTDDLNGRPEESNVLDRVTLVDQNTGEGLAVYDRDGTTWTRTK